MNEKLELPKPKEWRAKCLYLDESAIPYLIGIWSHLQDNIRIPKLKLPEGSRVTRTFIDHARASIGFIIESDTFEPVTPGMSAPEMYLESEIITIRERAA